MSRSWERKVRKNISQVNKVRKKSGQSQIDFSKPASKESNAPRFTGRNFIFPVVLLFFVGFYNFIELSNPKFSFNTIYFLTVISYLILAALFFIRKPYLTVSKEYLQSRRMFGDKQLFAVNIKQIKIIKGYVLIIPKNGTSWSFSQFFNRFPIAEMAKELKLFAERNHIEYIEE